MRRRTVSYLSLFVAALAVFLISGSQAAQQAANQANTPTQTKAQQNHNSAYTPQRYVVTLSVGANTVTASPKTGQVWVGDTIEGAPFGGHSFCALLPFPPF